MSVIDVLEEEAVFVLREGFGQFERPVLLFSGGKDSILLTHLAKVAFAPMRIPFPLLHVDTGHNFPETLEFRDRYAAEMGATLLVRLVQDTINEGHAVEETGPHASRNAIQGITLMQAIRELKVDAAIGGARRDEERARAKERFFSHRNAFGEWDPKEQRPEPWRAFNGLKRPGEHFRVFPLNNWTEVDVWRYIEKYELPLPNLYFSHERKVVNREGTLLASTEFLNPLPGEVVNSKTVRFRTVGDATCTGAIESSASNIAEVIEELKHLKVTERATRYDDKRSDAAMEDRKKAGYF